MTLFYKMIPLTEQRARNKAQGCGSSAHVPEIFPRRTKPSTLLHLRILFCGTAAL